MSHPARQGRRGRLCVVIAATTAVLLASCAAPTEQAAPPSTSFTPVSAVSSSGNPVTVPGLSTSSSSSASSSAEPVSSSEEATTEPTETPDEESQAEPEPEPEPEPRTTEPEPEPEPAPAPQPAQALSGGGRVVVIDPGHNGANAANPDVINALVDAGFGQTKPCNTTGTSTNDGYTEHEFTWSVAGTLRSLLENQGFTVVMTRDNDSGVGPCVNKRAAIGNDAGAAAVVSIHGDGDNASARGFYVMTAERAPAGADMAARSKGLAVNMRDGLESAGLSPSNHLGSDGLWQRGDLGGLNLSVRPTVMIELGNMRNSADAALMSSSSGRQQIAQGLANGVSSYLGAG